MFLIVSTADPALPGSWHEVTSGMITNGPAIPVVVEACTNLAAPDWSPVATNTLTGGASYFSDPEWTNYPNRFYRVRSP